MRLVYGNDAEENPESGLYQTSDYEYEVPTSDQDAIKFVYFLFDFKIPVSSF